MKKKLVSLFAAVLVISVITAFATDSVIIEKITDFIADKEEISKSIETKITETEIEKTKESVTEGLEAEMQLIMDRMRANGAYHDEVKTALEKYISVVSENEIPQEDKIRILNLAYENYDYNLILDIYKFILLTDLNVSDVVPMYELSLKCRNENPIENAYAVYTGRVDDELTISDVAHYVEKGVSIEEILSAYELSLTGDKRIKTVLDEYLSGKPAGEIVCESYSIESTEIKEEKNLNRVLFVRTVAKKMNLPMQTIAVSDENGNLDVEANAKEKHTENFGKSIREIKKVGQFRKIDTLIENDIKGIGKVSREQAKQLMEDGFTLREIKQAVKDKTISLKKGERPRITKGIERRVAS